METVPIPACPWASVSTGDICRGIVPFVILQLLGLVLVAIFPTLVTWLPGVIFG